MRLSVQNLQVTVNGKTSTHLKRRAQQNVHGNGHLYKDLNYVKINSSEDIQA